MGVNHSIENEMVHRLLDKPRNSRRFIRGAGASTSAGNPAPDTSKGSSSKQSPGNGRTKAGRAARAPEAAGEAVIESSQRGIRSTQVIRLI